MVLKNNDKVDKASIDDLAKVAGSVFSGGQYQIIIGMSVSDVYTVFMEKMGTPATEIETVTEKEESNVFNRFFKSIVGIMTPTFGVMGAAGILKGLLALSLALGWLQESDGAYQVWYAVSQAFFYYLPIWVGYNASKVFGGNAFIGAMLAAGLVFPDIVTAYTDKTAMTFFGIPIILVNYTQSLFPAMIASYIAAKIECFFKKILPELLRLMFVPFFTVLITAPLMFLVLGPVMTEVSDKLAAIVMSVYAFSPILFGVMGGAFWQIVVIFGLHYAFIPVLINNSVTLGYDPINAIFQVTVFALAGTAIGYAFKTKNPKGKSLGFSTGMTGLMGITEPIIYSITLPYRRQFIYAFIGGGLAGAIQALNSAVIYGFGGAGLLAYPLFIASDGNTASLVSFAIASAVAFFVPLALTVVLGTGEKTK